MSATFSMIVKTKWHFSDSTVSKRAVATRLAYSMKAKGSVLTFSLWTGYVLPSSAAAKVQDWILFLAPRQSEMTLRRTCKNSDRK